MLFERQRRLLQLLEAVGGATSEMDFQKLLFLYCQEPAVADSAPYDFIPCESGAISFTADADRRKLIEKGLLADEHGWQITDRARDVIGGAADAHITAFALRHRHLRGDPLEAETYRRFPYSAIRSRSAERVLGDDASALERIAAIRPEASGPALFTIGYEGHSLESYLVLLIQRGVTLLCDVRRNPLSRKYGFSKSTLARCSESAGIHYEHLPELGIASSQRRGLETQADYDALFEEYERAALPAQGDALEKLRNWVATGQRLALTCYERLPQQCHRHCVAEALEARVGAALSAQHL